MGAPRVSNDSITVIQVANLGDQVMDDKVSKTPSSAAHSLPLFNITSVYRFKSPVAQAILPHVYFSNTFNNNPSNQVQLLL